MSIIINILLFLVILTTIVAFHEFGHFLFAKLTGVYVYEFAIGMGPKIFGFKKGETEYTIRAIPIGGFCSLAGEDLDTDDEKKIPKERRLQNKKAWQRFLIMVFGPLNNFILAVLILFLLACIWGGSTMKPIITDVETGSAAEKSGIEAGDTVLKINGNKISTSDDIILYLAVAEPKNGTLFNVKHANGSKEVIKVNPKKEKIDGETSYKYGISMQQEKYKGIGGAFVYTFKKTVSIFKQMFITIKFLITGGISLGQLSGPVGIYSIVGQTRSSGIANVLYLMAFLSINVGFINLFPIPAFDGGHILFIIIELIKGSPVKPEIENMIHTVFLFLLMLLMVIITINDVIKLF